MKFTRGYWINKPGVQNYDCVQIREARVEGDRLYLYSVPYNKDERAMGGPVLEMFVSAPLPDIIRIEAWHFMGSNQKEPEFALNIQHNPLEVLQDEERITVKSGDTSLVITRNPASFTYYYKGEKLTNLGNRFGHSMISLMETPEGNFMRGQLDLSLGEKVYGFGERFTPFVKNGQVVETWNEDGGTCSEISYKSIPFYLTNKGYGVLVNSTDNVSYEVCSEVVTRVQFSVPGEKLDFMVVGGGDMKRVLENYTALSGRPALPPAWTFGLWLTSSFTTSYDEKTVMSFVDGMRERDIPLHVFHFDCYWMEENQWCNFTWDKKMFPDIDGMLSRMKQDKKLKICVWINPYIGQKSPLFKEAKELGYLLKRPNGDVWQWDMWQAGMGLVDFTNPGAWIWYQEKLRVLVRQGVDCFKTDFGERIPTDAVYYDGSDPTKMHNYYTQLYNKCVFDLLEEELGSGQACLFARSATVGGQQFPVHWGGDCSSNYLSMNETLRGGLSLCMSGFGFWSHDMSGFEGTAPADVYKRWAAFGLLSTHSRLHGSNSYRVPWLFGEESVDVLRYFTKLKCRLMPYMYTAAVKAHQTGVPVMRALVMEFPQDRSAEEIERQYMLGDSLMVCPVFSEDGQIEYYLPKGRWTNILSGEVIEGGGWKNEKHDFFSLPLLARENSIIPIGANERETDYDYLKGLCLELYSLTGSAKATVCDSKGNTVLKAEAENKGGAVEIKLSCETGIKDISILLVNVHKLQNLQGAQAAESKKGLVLSLQANTISFSL